jgi:serine/threonine-protein kinase
MIGTVLCIRYSVNQLLYENPIFAAYLAHDRIAGKDVCVKVFKQPFSTEKEFVEACFYHAQKVTAVHHPGIEKTLELDDHEGTPFLVCELPKGAILRERLRRFAPFSVPVAVAMATSICEPLHALHKAGIVHGDICAENIVMVGDGAAYLLQASQWQSYGHSRTAGMVALPGMAPYLAPEVSAGGMPSPESDVYAMGVLLYELLTGHSPYRADSPVALAMKHANENAPRVKALNSSVPMVLDEITHKALSKDPLQRYRSVGELLSDLRYLQDALRFGRSLSWPIRPEAVSDRPRVAPKMSAVRVEEKPQPRQKVGRDVIEDEPPVSDVPAWMRITGMVIVSMLVFFLFWWIFTSFSTTKEVEVPKIVNSSLSEATSILAQSHLRLSVQRREANDKYPAETIIAVQPRPGEKVKENGVVFVTVSTGSRFVDIPPLSGMTVDAARIVLKKINLDLDDRIIEKRSKNAEKGIIIGQNPDARERVPQSTKVRVTVSSGEDVPRTGSQTGVQRTWEVKIHLKGLPSSVMMRVDMVDDKGTRTVLEEEHFPDETVNVSAEGYGDQVLFKIYYDGELITTKPGKASEEPPTQ